MADNITIPGTGSSVATEDDGGGNQIQRVKISVGAKDTDSGDAELTHALPVYMSDGTNILGSSTHPVRSDPTGTTAQPITDNNGSLTVDNGGTFAVQAAQSGTWTVQPGNTANTTAWKVDGSAVVQPVNDNGGSLTVDGTVTANLGTIGGAATAAKQPALGTAGSASSDVLTVQGIASMTALKVDGSAVAQPITDNSGSLTVDAPLATPVFVTITPNTTGGWSVLNATSADGATALTNSAQTIKGSAGLFGGYYFYNPNSAAVWIHLYNNASPTVGTTNPQCSFCVGALASANIEITNGINFATAITAAATSTAGGNGAPTTALEVMFYYK